MSSESARQKKEYWQRNPEFRLFDSARTRAKKKGFEFTITREDVVIPEMCPLLGVPLVWDVNDPRADNKPSLDRIDSTKGYTPDNIQVVSWLANKIMSSATDEQVIKLARSLSERTMSRLRDRRTRSISNLVRSGKWDPVQKRHGFQGVFVFA